MRRNAGRLRYYKWLTAPKTLAYQWLTNGLQMAYRAHYKWLSKCITNGLPNVLQMAYSMALANVKLISANSVEEITKELKALNAADALDAVYQDVAKTLHYRETAENGAGFLAQFGPRRRVRGNRLRSGCCSP